MSNLPLMWTKHLKSDKEKREFELLLRNNTQLFKVLRRHFWDEVDELTRDESSVDDFDSAAWAFKQAYRNGRRAAFFDLIKLTNFIEGN